MEYYYLIMPNLLRGCISNVAKNYILALMEREERELDPSSPKDSLKLEVIDRIKKDLNTLPDCSALPQEQMPEAIPASGKLRKRPATAYNVFMGKCMKENKTMKECAAEYKKR